MDTSNHTMTTLFEQIGLPSDHESVEHFINDHKPLPKSTSLSKATFWTQSQATFFKEAIAEDSDWAEVVDQLDALLRY